MFRFVGNFPIIVFVTRFSCSVVLHVALGLITASSLYAEVKSVSLAESYSRFAVQPETGVIAALHRRDQEVHFFRRSDLEVGLVRPVSKVQLPDKPSQVVYKNYGQRRLFAIACESGAELHLIDATRSDEFSVLASIRLKASCCVHLATSLSTKDPFIYCTTRDSREPSTEIVSVKDFISHGDLPGHAYACTPSPTGRTLYLLENPRSIRVSSRLSKFSEDLQRFSYVHSVAVAKPQLCLDPFEELAIVGSDIYSTELVKKNDALPISPSVYLGNEPFVIGYEEVELDPLAGAGVQARSTFGNRDGKEKAIRILACSTRTLSPVGKEIVINYNVKRDPTLPVDSVPSDSISADSVPAQRGFTKAPEAPLPQLLVIPTQRLLVLADSDSFHLIPWDELELPEVPRLSLRPTDASVLTVGTEADMTLETIDSRARVTEVSTPSGVSQDGNRVRWTPSREQLGSQILSATITDGIESDVKQVNVFVASRHLSLPFTPGGFEIDDANQQVLIWDTPNRDASLNQQRRLALIDLNSMRIVAERNLSRYAAAAAFSKSRIAVVPASENMNQCYFLERSNLNFVKESTFSSPIKYIGSGGDVFLVQDSSGLHVFPEGTLKSVAAGQVSFQKYQSWEGQLWTSFGYLTQGFLYGFDGEKKLLIAPERLFDIDESQPSIPSMLIAKSKPVLSESSRNAGKSRSRNQDLLVYDIPGTREKIKFEVQSLPGDMATGKHATRKLFLQTPKSSKPELLDVVPQPSFVSSPSNESLGLFTGTQRGLWCYFGRNLYKKDLTLPPKKSDAVFVISPKQSHFLIATDQKSELHHEVLNGRGRTKFSLASDRIPMSIEADTGVVTLDPEAFVPYANRKLAAYLKNNVRGSGIAIEVTSYQRRVREHTRHFIGRYSEKLPVTLPIEISASDSAGSQSNLRYHVIVELNPADVIAELEEMLN
ncbi:MAG: hypothetical protein ACK52S_18285 [Pirellula sp.]